MLRFFFTCSWIFADVGVLISLSRDRVVPTAFNSWHSVQFVRYPYRPCLTTLIPSRAAWEYLLHHLPQSRRSYLRHFHLFYFLTSYLLGLILPILTFRTMNLFVLTVPLILYLLVFVCSTFVPVLRLPAPAWYAFLLLLSCSLPSRLLLLRVFILPYVPLHVFSTYVPQVLWEKVVVIANFAVLLQCRWCAQTPFILFTHVLTYFTIKTF